MQIAIIGAGNVGRALATSSVRAGHSVTISSRERAHAEAVAGEVGARAAKTNREAVEAGELVIAAVPYEAVSGLVEELRQDLRGKVLVDVTNPLTSDYTGLVTEGTSGAEEIQRLIPDVPVVKAFNAVLAARQANPTVEGVELDGFVAGTDAEAKAKVLEFVRSLGLRPIDAGPLQMARSLEAMALLNITLNLRNNWPWQSGWKLLGLS